MLHRKHAVINHAAVSNTSDSLYQHLKVFLQPGAVPNSIGCLPVIERVELQSTNPAAIDL